MTALLTASTAILLTATAEWLHARRCRRVSRLAFGPSGKPREWTRLVPALRVFSIGALAWGMTTLLLVGPRAARSDLIPEGGYRHLVLALDVSPSMQLQDAGPGGQQTRAKRASDVIMSLFERVAMDQMRVSIVAFYTSAKPVVIDTFDMEVIRNCLNDLPLDIAFEPGKTALLEGVRQSAELAKPWPPESATLVVLSDGDTIPDSGTPDLPRSIHRALILGVGDARSGRNIDGHQSRQDVSTLRQLAGRLRGAYFDANEKHLPSSLLTTLAKTLPLRDTREKGRRELALAAIGLGASLLAALPVALALAGCRWQGGAQSGKVSFRAVAKAKPSNQEKMTYA